jgi:hypothetical protein
MKRQPQSNFPHYQGDSSRCLSVDNLFHKTTKGFPVIPAASAGLKEIFRIFFHFVTIFSSNQPRRDRDHQEKGNATGGQLL